MNDSNLKNVVNFFIVSEKLKEESFFNCEDIQNAVDRSINKAYSDAKRTFHGISKYEEEKNNAISELKEKAVNYFSTASFPKTQDDLMEGKNHTWKGKIL